MDAPAERIRQARLAQGWATYRQADKATGISRDNWANWETGRNLPSWDSFKLLAEKLQVSEWWLISGEGDGPAGPVPGEEPPPIVEAQPRPRGSRGRRSGNGSTQ